MARLYYLRQFRELIASNTGTVQKGIVVKWLLQEDITLTESYKRVQLEPRELSISRSTYSPARECVRAGWKRSRSWFAVWSPNAAKHGRVESTRKRVNEYPALWLLSSYLFALVLPKLYESPTRHDTDAKQSASLTDDPVTVLPCGLEPLLEQPPKLQKGLASNTT